MGSIFDNTAYEMNTKILPEVCTLGKIKISELMMLHQQIGEKHLNAFGTTSADMRAKQNIAFIFTKARIVIHRLPQENEEITVRTWCSELKGVRFTRNYQTFDKIGNALTEAKCEVTTINLETRKIVRPASIEGFADFLYNNELANACEAPQKIDAIDNAQRVSQRKASAETIDFNSHVNNTMYADFAMSIIPDITELGEPQSVDINFINEVMPNEIIDLYLASVEDKTLVVTGRVGDETPFCCKLVF